MAIQNRRGNYTDFDKTKMVAGEIAVVQSGDPIGSDGTAVYVAFQSGNAKRLATHEDIVNEISNATEEITNELVETIEQDVADDLSAAQTAASNASASASTASEKASEAAASATQAAQTVENIIDNTLTQSGKAADAKKVGDELSDLKEDFNELESDGVVASAEQLLSDKYTVDQVPYHYRASASSGANREYDEIVGGTINWNQLVDTNTTSVTVPSNHKYLAYIGGSYTIGISTGTTMSVTGGTDMVHDLTAMFGSTIADYIYSLEQTTAGAGVALFRQLIKNGYHEFNEGTLMSVSGLQSHDMVGFNRFDKSTASPNSAITAQGVVTSGSFYVSDFIRVIPNTDYYIKDVEVTLHVRSLVFYDANKNFVSVESVSGGDSIHAVSFVKHIPSGVHYIRIGVNPSYVDSACVSISSDRNGEYELYEKHSYPLDSSLTLRGIPKLDSNNQIYFDGDTYSADGTVTRKYGTRAYQEGDESLADAITDGTNTVYKLITPTTETAEPFAEVQKVDPYGTEEYVTTSIVPVGHYTKYPENLKAKIENLDLSMIAPIETGTTASQAYAVGKYFLLNNKFCKAKTAIASGATFTLNTNYEVTTIADELYTALQ